MHESTVYIGQFMEEPGEVPFSWWSLMNVSIGGWNCVPVKVS